MQLILRDVRLLQYTMKRSCRLATCRTCRSRTHNSPQHSWRPSVWLLSQLRACAFLGFVREQSPPIFPRYSKNNQIDTRFVCKNKYFLPSARSIHHAGMLLPAQTLRMPFAQDVMRQESRVNLIVVLISLLFSCGRGRGSGQGRERGRATCKHGSEQAVRASTAHTSAPLCKHKSH